MNCPHKDSFMPRCQITTHPDRANVEYCRVCGEWRYLSDIGDDTSRTVWAIAGSAVLMMIFVAMVNQRSTPQPSQPLYQKPHYLEQPFDDQS